MQLADPISGPHIRLRSMTQDDLVHKVSWFNNPEIRKSLILDETLELDKTIQWFASVKDSPARLDLFIETMSSMPIGLISLVHIDAKHKTAEIILVIGNKDFWGKGVMLEAESLLIQWAFSHLKIEKIWAQTRLDNVASLITMKKLGFQIEGTLRRERIIDGQRIDIVHLGLLPEQFRPAPLA